VTDAGGAVPYPRREGVGVLLVTVLLMTLILVVAGMILLVTGSVQGGFVLVSLSVGSAALAGIVGMLSARSGHARDARLVTQVGPDELRAKAASSEDRPPAGDGLSDPAAAPEHGLRPTAADGDPDASADGPFSGRPDG
jgi:hypothetical protein